MASELTELSTIIIVFAVLAIIFQAVAHRTFANELSWAKSDYFWLCIAALGLLSLTAEARRDDASTLIPIQKEYTIDVAAMAEENVAFSVNYLTIFSEINIKDETPDIATQKQEFITLKDRLLPYLDYFRSFPNPGWASSMNAFHNEDALRKGLTDPAALRRAASVAESMDVVKKSHDELMELQAEFKASIMERIRIHLGPFLLAFALALRLGKTTADVKRKLKG